MTEINSRSAVDRLARLRARLRELEAKEAELVEFLRRSNHDTIAGRRFVATITRSHREIVDSDRVRELLAERTPTKTISTFSVRTAPRVRPATGAAPAEAAPAEERSSALSFRGRKIAVDLDRGGERLGAG